MFYMEGFMFLEKLFQTKLSLVKLIMDCFIHNCFCLCRFRTLTPPVELIRCLKSIREHAFVASPYPVIITLEDHLTPNLQAKVAEVKIKQNEEK